MTIKTSLYLCLVRCSNRAGHGISRRLDCRRYVGRCSVDRRLGVCGLDSHLDRCGSGGNLDGCGSRKVQRCRGMAGITVVELL